MRIVIINTLYIITFKVLPRRNKQIIAQNTPSSDGYDLSVGVADGRGGPAYTELSAAPGAPYQDALVHVAIVVFYADADDTGVFALLVVSGGQHCGGNRRHRDRALVHFGVVVAGRRGREGVE